MTQAVGWLMLRHSAQCDGQRPETPLRMNILEKAMLRGQKTDPWWLGDEGQGTGIIKGQHEGKFVIGKTKGVC